MFGSLYEVIIWRNCLQTGRYENALKSGETHRVQVLNFSYALNLKIKLLSNFVC